MIMTTRTFGIEIEAAGISRERAARLLRLVGLEAAVEGYNHATRGHWKIVSDASVRNGFEVVSPVLRGEEGLEQIRTAITALDDGGARINVTCGLHVHFNADDLSCATIKNILIRYAEHEPEIDAFMPNSRRGNANQYCRSIRRLVEAPGFAAATTIEQLARHQSGRYFKVNLQSYHRHGTIEFRQHSGTVNAPKALTWIRFLAAFIEESARLADASAQEPLPSLTPAQHRLYRLLNRDCGMNDLIRATGCQAHSIRAAITRLRQAGITVAMTRENGETRYRIQDGAMQTSTGLWTGMDESIIRYYRNRTAVLAA